MQNYQVLTYTPIRNPLSVRPEVNEYSEHYRDFIESIAEQVPPTLELGHYVPLGIRDEHKRYDDLACDSVECRLFTLEKFLPEHDCTLTFHCYPGGVAIIESVFELPQSDATEQTIIEINEYAVGKWLPELLVWFDKIQRWDKQQYKYLHSISSSLLSDVKASGDPWSKLSYWTSRCLLINPAVLSESESILRRWLSNTGRSDEVEPLLSGERQYSMCWLNYVIVGTDMSQQEQLRDTMRVAQYFYTARQRSIEMLQMALAKGSELKEKTRSVEQLLKTAMTFSRSNDVFYHESLKYFKLEKRERVDAILVGWRFEKLASSIHTLEDLCQGAISGVQRQQQYRSSIYTDLILVFIGFLTILELVVALSAYSREFVLRPTLSYLDSSYSAVLGFIAWINTDVLMLSGVFTVLGLLGLYSYVKLK